MNNDDVFALPTPAGEFGKYWALVADAPAPRIEFALDEALSKSGRDAYAVSERDGALVFRASNLRSQFYAVYDFFHRLGCRWYWDGDALPAKGAVAIGGIDIREESRFEYRGLRYFAHRGLTRFQAEHWGPAEWRREIDWCLKNRLNLFMPRIGMDDTWQKAYPDEVPYPNPAEKLPEAIRGFDDRSLFWSLEYRGELRRRFTKYAYGLGLMVPVDFGTMTHWYSRTPRAFLEKRHPDFLPQVTKGYSEETGRVFDIRKPGYLDIYWRLSEAFMEAGYGKPELMHTIGLGERMVYENRADNLKLKIDVIKQLCAKVAAEYPDAKVLLAGWDFYFTWKPDEVRALLPELDPSRTVVFDYEADARDTDYDWFNGGMRNNNFTKWGVVRNFPYVFGIFLCYESGIDIRANYPLIAERQKVIEGDDMCKGYILWPESSHTDILGLEYFTANAWSGKSASVDDLLHDLCERRYGTEASAMEKAWRLLLPMTAGAGWGDNCVQQLTTWLANYADDPWYYPAFAELKPQVEAVPAVYEALRALDWEASPAVRRDAIDIARTACDRQNLCLRQKLFRSFDAWTRGEGGEEPVLAAAAAFEREAARLADILALHTDYSVYESYLRLDAVEKIRNKNFARILLDNTTAPYCRSHQYETVRHWYVPLVGKFAAEIRRRLAAGEKKSLNGEPLPKEWNDALGAALLDAPPESLRPVSSRTREDFVRALS